ncbi:GNAT family N-acetyltransferase [Paenibacillus sp. WQ 127069]|uniref:GNAT family N-acetyltransferase n=1 Tax=Paenibacillus baimaensis TaxID=2982185 RepID=A0ABT2USN6_9BACL|nr:GNAT family N-acetyltransferase [Paenibacillus sp. WQ 127069]MCU6797572.1 GNAT family N-acetyltransferase [Paenibacillus sp. WQ 127069]
MSINYREAVLQDEEELFSLAASLATSYKPNMKDYSTIFKDLLSDRNADIIIAETDARLIGYVLVFHHSTFYANGVISWVEELFVIEEFRGKKIGKKLMELVEEKAYQRNSKLVALATRRAGSFYKAIGYDDSAVYFKKTLSQE